MPLKKYIDEQVKKQPISYEPSGVEHPKEDGKGKKMYPGEELMITVPYERNERGEYRCVGTDYRGWVKYTPPPKPITPPLPEADDEKLARLVNEYQKSKDMVDLGLFSEAELDIPAKRAEIRKLHKKINP